MAALNRQDPGRSSMFTDAANLFIHDTSGYDAVRGRLSMLATPECEPRKFRNALIQGSIKR